MTPSRGHRDADAMEAFVAGLTFGRRLDRAMREICRKAGLCQLAAPVVSKLLQPRPRDPIRRAFLAVECGVAFGYPLCCVEAYALDVLDGRLPAALRGTVPLGARHARYVPCAV